MKYALLVHLSEALKTSEGMAQCLQQHSLQLPIQSDFYNYTTFNNLSQELRLTQSPTFSAQGIQVISVYPSTSGRVNLVMSSRQQEIISSASGNTLLEQLEIVGDTHAADISADGNCYDTVRINSVTFKPVRVTIEPRP